MDLTGGLPVEFDLAVLEPPPDDRWYGENHALWLWDEERSLGIHLYLKTLGHMGLYRLRRETINVHLADGTVLMSETDGPGAVEPRVARGANLEMRCIEPFTRWSYRFDATAQPTSAAQMREGLLRHMPLVPLAFELEGTMALPPALTGSLGLGERTEWAREFFGARRYEQFIRAEGTIRVDGGELPFAGVGMRTHRVGGRNLTDFPGHTWMMGLFPSGRAFCVNRICGGDGVSQWEEGYVSDGSSLHPAQAGSMTLCSTELPGEALTLEIESDGARALDDRRHAAGDELHDAHARGPLPLLLGDRRLARRQPDHAAGPRRLRVGRRARRRHGRALGAHRRAARSGRGRELSEPDRRLAGRVAVVTGASRGLGSAIAAACAGAGAEVALIARGAEALDGVAASIGAAAGSFPADVADPASVRRAFAAIGERHGRVDLLVNNAGGGAPKALERLSDAELEAQVATNLLGPLHCIRAALPLLRAAGGGDVVNISSVAVLNPYPLMWLYSAAKAALELASTGLADELRADDVRVSVLRSGSIGGTAFQEGWDADERDRAFALASAQGRARFAGGAPVSPDLLAGWVVEIAALPREARAGLVELRPR